MMRYWFPYLLLGALSSGQTVTSQSTAEAQHVSVQAPDTVAYHPSEQTQSLPVSGDRPVITINGLCDNSPAGKTAVDKCKTVITQAQFERLILAVEPNMPQRARREFALSYTDVLVMSKKAEQLGLDKTANYDEQMKLARIQVLSKELKEELRQKVSQISPEDIKTYYNNNIIRFERAELDRIYVPKMRRPAEASSDQGLSTADAQEPEQNMKQQAAKLRARALAGEDFKKLQADAYQAGGIKGSTPSTRIKIGRFSLPANQLSVMDLRPGEVSSVLVDPSGYVIYKMISKDTLPLEQARQEISAALRSQRMHKEMRDLQDSVTPILDEDYFLPNRPTLGTSKATPR